MLKELNLNDMLHVYLNENGKKILREFYATDDISSFESKERHDHYALQLWVFANIFGGKGTGGSAPYSCAAFIEE